MAFNKKARKQEWYHFINFFILFFFIIKLQSTIHLNRNIGIETNCEKNFCRIFFFWFSFIFPFYQSTYFQFKATVMAGFNLHYISLVKREFFEFYWTITKEYQWIMKLIFYFFLLNVAFKEHFFFGKFHWEILLMKATRRYQIYFMTYNLFHIWPCAQIN